MENTNLSEYYSVKDLQKIFNLGKNKAYQLIKQPGFPRIKIGREYYIPKKAFEVWAERQIKKESGYRF